MGLQFAALGGKLRRFAKQVGPDKNLGKVQG